MGFHLLTGHSEIESHRLDVLLFFSSRLLPPFFSSSLRNQFFHFGAMALGRHLEISPGFADSFQIPSKKIFFLVLLCAFSPNVLHLVNPVGRGSFRLGYLKDSVFPSMVS